MAFAASLRHARAIETTAPTFPTRHASPIATALLGLSVSAALATVWLDTADVRGIRLLNDPGSTISELLCFGIVGAVLIARRPDLPFGWVLALAASADLLLVGVGVPSLQLATRGEGGQLAMWGVSLGVLQWAPTALAGVINVRFPSGRPSSRWGRWLDRALCVGIPVGLVGNYLGDSVVADLRARGTSLPADGRFVDGTWVTPLGNASLAMIPLLILLGILAGIGVVVRCVRSHGVERKQLQWRAVGVGVSLLLFPLAVSGVIEGASRAIGVLAPLVLVTTLALPVLLYQLWSGDPVRRRRRVRPLVSRRTLLEAQEEERRRLRRDLHDGLGPLLTGLRLTLDAVDAQLTSDPEQARRHLATARSASAEVISDLRGLVYGLRPPALDELGLAGSLRMHLTALAQDSPLEISVDVEEPLDLPAAVEVALYRTAAEAVTNVLKHSTARRCAVTVATRGPSVVLTVDDDGPVLDTWRAGVGLGAMRERAVELGGTFVAGSGPSGFHVIASYPRR